MNHICIIGRLTADPVMRTTGKGVKVANYFVAVDDGGENVDFLPVVSWDKAAEFAEKFFIKGQRVAVEGSMKQQTWTDKEGKKRTTYVVRASRQYFADGKKHTPTDDAAKAPDTFRPVGDDVLPFN